MVGYYVKYVQSASGKIVQARPLLVTGRIPKNWVITFIL